MTVVRNMNIAGHVSQRMIGYRSLIVNGMNGRRVKDHGMSAYRKIGQGMMRRRRDCWRMNHGRDLMGRVELRQLRRLIGWLIGWQSVRGRIQMENLVVV